MGVTLVWAACGNWASDPNANYPFGSLYFKPIGGGISPELTTALSNWESACNNIANLVKGGSPHGSDGSGYGILEIEVLYSTGQAPATCNNIDQDSGYPCGCANIVYMDGAPYSGRITIWKYNHNGNQCAYNDADRIHLLTHEIGHALGLGNGNCTGAMGLQVNNQGDISSYSDPSSGDCSPFSGHYAEEGEDPPEGGTDPCNAGPTQGFGAASCVSTPILLDIGGRGGIWTTGSNDPVVFDMDVDGTAEFMTWSAAGRSQAFLAYDLSGNGLVDDGGELFGSGTFLASEGIQAAHGFEALSQYDAPANGGNGDGVIDPSDAVWEDLRLWVDRNHSATTDKNELMPLEEFGVVALELEFLETDKRDRYGNWHRYRSAFRKRTKIQGEWVITRELMEDVYFRKLEPE